VLLVDHDQFDLTSIATNGHVVLDCRRVLSGPNIEVL
jgi:UDP-N-acetyl-D-mannosaminuronate dehydrogenase